MGIIEHLVDEDIEVEQIDGIMPERRPLAAEHGELPAPSGRIGLDSGHVHPVRIRPGIGVDLGERGVLERTGQRNAVAIAVALDVEGGSPGDLRGGQLLVGAAFGRSGVGAEHATKVIADVAQQGLIILQLEIGACQLLPFGARAQPAGHMIRLPVREGRQDTFFGGHLLS